MSNRINFRKFNQRPIARLGIDGVNHPLEDGSDYRVGGIGIGFGEIDIHQFWEILPHDPVVFGVGEIFSLDDRECSHDVIEGVERGREITLELGELLRRFGMFVGLRPVAEPEIETEEDGVEFTPKDEAALLVPFERREDFTPFVGITTVLRERCKIGCCVGQFKNTGKDKIAKCL